MLVILKLPLKDIAAVGGVDLLDSQLFSVLDGLAVHSSAAGDGADAADLDGGAGVSAGALACLRSSGGGRSLRRSSGALSSRRSRGTAGSQAQHHRSCQNRTNEFFHFDFPPKKFSQHRRFAAGVAQPRIGCWNILAIIDFWALKCNGLILQSCSRIFQLLCGFYTKFGYKKLSKCQYRKKFKYFFVKFLQTAPKFAIME